MQTRRVLVTGCSGFLGRYVVQELARVGHEVVGFDLIEPSYSIASYRKGDFTSETDLRESLERISTVCHLGGIGDVYLADKDPGLAFRANAFGAKVLCDACLDCRVEKLIYASTWEVYGKPLTNPVDEAHPCNPESPYSISKLAGELFARHLGSEGPVISTVLRLGTAYGPAMRNTTVISRFLERAIQRKPLTVHGSGNQFRQFTHAADIARAFALAVSSSNPGSTYNIVAGEKITILDLAQIIAGHFGGDVEFVQPRKADPPSALVTSELARRALGWVPTVPFREGLLQLMKAGEE